MARITGKPVLFAGVATLDTVALVDAFPNADERVVARDLITAGGGPAATAAVAAARLGARNIGFVGTVGDDAEGECVIAGLEAEGVDVSGIRRLPGTSTGASAVIVDRGRGTRAICTRPPPPLLLDDRQRGLLTTAEWVHVDHHGWAELTEVIHPAHSRRPRISVDAGNPIESFTPKDVDLYVPTLEALATEFGDRSDEELLRFALAQGARTVVATRGSRGAVSATVDGQHSAVPAHAVDVVSTLGAGDVFHGALVAAVLYGYELPECLHYANTAAALSCLGLDGRSAIPGHDEVIRSLTQHAN